MDQLLEQVFVAQKKAAAAVEEENEEKHYNVVHYPRATDVTEYYPQLPIVFMDTSP